MTEAGPSKPYLGIVLELDRGTMREVLKELECPPAAAESVQNGVFVSDFAGPIADCAARTVQLLDTP